MDVVIGRFHFPDASTRAFTRSAMTFLLGRCGKIADRYCVPMSFPCRLSVVGRRNLKNHCSSSSSC
jgi:hypothetical protein